MQQLRMLREVSVRGTIGAAASELGYTPSAVSQQLSAVEKSTGVAVLERVGRNVQLTDAGRELVSHASVVLAQLEEAQAAIERVSGHAAGTMRIGVTESVAATIIPGVLRRLAKQHPDVSLRTRQVDPDVALETVRAGGLDATFAIDYVGAPMALDPSLARQLVCRDWFKLVVPTGDPLAIGRTELATIAGRSVIASPSDMSCGRCVLYACRSAGFEPDLVHELDDYSTSLLLVAEGAGVSLVPDLGLHAHIPDGVEIVELVDPFFRTVELVHRSSSEDRPAFRALAEAIQAEADALGLDRG